MLHPLLTSEIRARESTGKGRLGFRCRAVISYSFINISLACFIRRGDFTSPQPKPQENVRQVKAVKSWKRHPNPKYSRWSTPKDSLAFRFHCLSKCYTSGHQLYVMTNLKIHGLKSVAHGCSFEAFPAHRSSHRPCRSPVFVVPVVPLPAEGARQTKHSWRAMNMVL